MIRKDLDVGENLKIKANEMSEFADKWQPILQLVNELDPIVRDTVFQKIISFIDLQIQDLILLKSQKTIDPPAKVEARP